jgi:hypothetical protein
MSTLSPEDRLARAFAVDLPPARDFAFSLAVMEKVARKRLLNSVMLLACVALLAALVLWAVAPAFEPLFESVAEGVWPVIPAALLAGFLALISWQVLTPAGS